MTNAEAWFSNPLRPRKPEGSLGRTAQDGHLDSHTAPELSILLGRSVGLYINTAGTQRAERLHRDTEQTVSGTITETDRH